MPFENNKKVHKTNDFLEKIDIPPMLKNQETLPLHLEDYLQLVDWSGRQFCCHLFGV